MFNPRGWAEIISQQFWGQILSSGVNAFSVLKKDGLPRKARYDTGRHLSSAGQLLPFIKC
jgi:hypothetical protein